METSITTQMLSSPSFHALRTHSKVSAISLQALLIHSAQLILVIVDMLVL